MDVFLWVFFVCTYEDIKSSRPENTSMIYACACHKNIYIKFEICRIYVVVANKKRKSMWLLK